jgi:predicted unusual protein kinase regulating ubiquinone biosynthesis (AarF/ABC1/UbiB family)
LFTNGHISNIKIPAKFSSLAVPVVVVRSICSNLQGKQIILEIAAAVGTFQGIKSNHIAVVTTPMKKNNSWLLKTLFNQPFDAFDGRYYDHYSILIDDFLRFKEYWQSVSQEIIDHHSEQK